MLSCSAKAAASSSRSKATTPSTSELTSISGPPPSSLFLLRPSSLESSLVVEAEALRTRSEKARPGGAGLAPSSPPSPSCAARRRSSFAALFSSSCGDARKNSVRGAGHGQPSSTAYERESSASCRAAAASASEDRARRRSSAGVEGRRGEPGPDEGSGSGRPFSDAAGAAAGLKERRGEEELVALAVWLLLLCFLFLLFFFSFFSFDRRGRRALLLLLLRRPPPARRRDGSRGRGQRAAPPDVLLPGAGRGPLGVGFGRGDVRRRPGPASAAAVPNGVADAAFLFFFFGGEKTGFREVLSF